LMRSPWKGRLQLRGTKVIWEEEDWSERYEKAQTKLIIENNQDLYRALPWELEAYEFEDKVRKQLLEKGQK
ncbi:hypothetical protein AB4565_18275, partial [Vibrio breoganii]